MNIKMIDGSNPNNGQTVVTDHIVETVTINIRTINGISLELIKDLIQQKYEVTNIALTDETAYCRKP